MHWELSDEQNLFAQSLREWLAARVGADQLHAWLDAGNYRSFDDALTEEGWAGVGFDEAVGGQGGGLLEMALTSRELGRAAAPSARWLAQAVADAALTHEPKLARAAVADGDLSIVAVRCDRIPSTGSVLPLRDGRVSGQVPCVLAADEADRFLVPVAIPQGGTGLAVVERDGGGVHVHPRALLDRSRSASDVVFDAAPARPIELDGDADAVLTALAQRAAVLVAADALGAAERMLDMTVDYAKQRKQFGRPIGAFQAVKHAAAQMLVTVESSYSVALFAAASVQDAGPEAVLHAAAAKAQVTAHCAELADAALTVHGAIGYTWEYDLQLFYKRAKLDRILFGPPEAWNERIAAKLPIVPVAS